MHFWTPFTFLYQPGGVEVIGIDDNPKELGPVNKPHEGELSRTTNSILRPFATYRNIIVPQDDLPRSMASKRSFPVYLVTQANELFLIILNINCLTSLQQLIIYYILHFPIENKIENKNQIGNKTFFA